MRKLLIALLLFAFGSAVAQPTNYTRVAGRYRWTSGFFDSTLHLPSGSTPKLGGGFTGPGALFYKTTDSLVYLWTGYQWKGLSIAPNTLYNANDSLTSNRTVSTTTGKTLTFQPVTTFSAGKINITELPGGSNSINVTGPVGTENLMWVTRESNSFSNTPLYQYNTMVFKGDHNPGAGFGNMGGGNVQFNTVFGEGHKFRDRTGLSGQYLFGRGFVVAAGNNTSIGIGNGQGAGEDLNGGDIQLITNSAANVYFGKVTDGNEQKYDAMSTLHGISGTGTNNVGKNLRIAGGRGTGSSNAGDVLFMTANTGASGTTLQTLQYRMGIFGNTGNVIIGNGGTIVPSWSDGGYKFQVTGTGMFTGALYTGNPANTTWNGPDNQGVFFVKSSTSGGGGLSFAAPSAANNHQFLSLRVDGGYNAWLSMGGGTLSTSGNFSTYAITAAGSINARNSILISDNTDNERGINFWREGNAGRSSIVHNSAGQIFINTGDAGTTPSSTTGFNHIRLDGAAGTFRAQNTLIRSQNNAIGDTVGTPNVAAVLELKNGGANFYGLKLPAIDTLSRKVIADGGSSSSTNYTGDFVNGSNIITNYTGGGTITVGNLIFPFQQGSENSYLALKNGDYRAIVTNVSGTTITMDRPYTGPSGNGYVPRIITPTVPAGLMIYNSSDKTIDYHNGTAWQSLATGSNFYTTNGTLTSNRTVTMGGNTLSLSGGNLIMSDNSGSQKIRFENGVYIEDGAAGGRNVQIGNSSGQVPKGQRNVAIGNDAAYANANYQIVIGQATSRGGNGVAIGLSASAGANAFAVNAYAHDNSIAFSSRYGTSTSASDQFVVEAPDWYLRNPALADQNGSASSINGTGVSGTNFSGGNITIAGGKGTGNAAPGDVIFATATPTTSGTTLQTLTNRVWIKGDNGNVGIGASPDNAYKLDVGIGNARMGNLILGGTSGQGEITLGKINMNYVGQFIFHSTYGLNIDGNTSGNGTITINGNLQRYLNGLEFTNVGKQFTMKRLQGGADTRTFLDIAGADQTDVGQSGAGGVIRIYGGLNNGTQEQGLVVLGHTGSAARGAVIVGGTSPATSAIFQVDSNTRGVLLTRMTTTEINAIASPATGLIVYNTTLNELCFYDGTAWRKFSHSTM